MIPEQPKERVVDSMKLQQGGPMGEETGFQELLEPV
jgi:hypothetical protein